MTDSAALGEFIESDLWEDGYFMPERKWPKTELYVSGYAVPLLASLVNGCGSTPAWSRVGDLTMMESFFALLRPAVSRRGASWFYVTDPDNALSVLEWVRSIEARYLNAMPLREFETNPADQGGTSSLGLLFHDLSGTIVFELADAFRILLFGEPGLENEILAKVSNK